MEAYASEQFVCIDLHRHRVAPHHRGGAPTSMHSGFGAVLYRLLGGLLLGIVPDAVLIPLLVALLLLSSVRVWRHDRELGPRFAGQGPQASR